MKALSAAFQSKCSIGGPQVGGKASKLLQNTAVKRVLRLVNQFHHTSHRPTRSHAPVFVVIDTNSLEKRLLNAWRRGHSNGQYQQKVSCGQEPLVNGVIPMAVLREVDFYNKQGVKKVGSLQRILEDQFRCFNEDKPCFLHPQGVEQVYQHSSTVCHTPHQSLMTASMYPSPNPHPFFVCLCLVYTHVVSFSIVVLHATCS